MKVPNDVIKQVWAKNNPRFEKDLLENQMLFFTMGHQSKLLLVLVKMRKCTMCCEKMSYF